MKTETNSHFHLAAPQTKRATVSSAKPRALFAPASNDCKPVKRGHPQDRKAMSDFMRAQRARFHTLHGGWTRSQWNHQVTQAALNNLERLTDVRKHIDAIRERNAAEADLADMRDPWAARRKREEQALETERAVSPHLWGQS